MKSVFLMAVSTAALALAGCGGGSTGTSGGTTSSVPTPPAPTPPPPPPPPPPPASTERDILPATTNAAININLSAHTVINPDPAVTSKNRLFVMLPGTASIPRFYRFILRSGAPRGYHVIGLNYPNDDAIGTLCATSVVADCQGLARNEVITGQDTSPVVSVDRANSITGRLVSLLTYLAATYPTEGWGQYLSAGQPNWSLITVGGHSQGAGHAGYLAKLQSLDRVVMLSGPSDVGVAPGFVAPWLSQPNVTPASRQYGFTHVADGLVSVALATRNWDLIGLGAFGAANSVDGATAPFGDSRKLTTNAAPNPSGVGLTVDAAHGAPVVDVVTPLTPAGTPVFAPVWNYMAFP